VGRLAGRLARTRRVIYFAHGLPCAPGQNRLKRLRWYSIERVLSRITHAVLVMND
jgi:hypothetical protein